MNLYLYLFSIYISGYVDFLKYMCICIQISIHVCVYVNLYLYLFSIYISGYVDFLKYMCICIQISIHVCVYA